MACTTILVGKKASYDGSTMIARNDDSPSGIFHVKKLVVVPPEKQPRHYVSAISKVEIDLPDNPLSYTATPNVDPSEGIWAASGTNSEGVSMTATETITTNERVLGADPLEEKGIGEEDLVVLILPYIHSAKEGVIRLGELLAKYGTYESNGMAFSDGEEIWWVETIGGHHFIARRVPDDVYVNMPNQFGLDHFDFDDAMGAQKEYMCSPDLLEFTRKNHLDLGNDGDFNPRLAYGSHSDADHVYNTPRAWFMVRYLNPHLYDYDSPNADCRPEDDDIPWMLKPERKVTVEDVKYLLSSHFQGTPYDPYLRFGDKSQAGKYRSIGVNRTAVLCLHQNKVGEEPILWLAFGSNTFNAFVPLFARVPSFPEYFSNTTMTVDTSSFYWASRLIGALADPHFTKNQAHIERYQEGSQSKATAIINKARSEFASGKDKAVLTKANEEIAGMMKTATDKALNNVLFETSCLMKNGYSRSDN